MIEKSEKIIIKIKYKIKVISFLKEFFLFRSDLHQRVRRVLQGFIEENCPVNSRTIRIFLSSTFTGE